MDNEKDKETTGNQEVNLDKHADHSHDDHGHGHGGHGHDESEPIVLHQEKLLPTMLLASCLVIVTLFGLYAAGGTKLDISTGKAAFDKVKNEKVMLDQKNNSKGNMNNQGQNSQEEQKPVTEGGTTVEGTVEGH